MRKLERKILKEVYSFESKQTLLKIVLRLTAILSFTSGVVLLIGVIMETLVKQQTLDLLEIFQEDFETIRENIWNVLVTFFQEAPILEIFIVVLISFLTIVLLLHLVLNFTRIKNKLIWLIRFLSEK